MEIRIKTAEEFWRDKVSIEISGTAAEVQTVGQQITRGRTAGYWAEACERAEAEVRELKEARAGDAGTIEALREQVADLGQQLLTAQQAREIETQRAKEYDRDRHTEQERANRMTSTAETRRQRVIELEAELERYRKAHVCTVECTENAHTAFQGRTLVTELETALADAQTRIGELDGQLRRALAEQARRFTVDQVEDAKAGAREDARAEMYRETVSPLNERIEGAERDLAALADLLGKVNGLALGNEVRKALEYMPAEPGTHAHAISVALRGIRDVLGAWTPRSF
jgi:DNA repair exonuclease SbcCD ATPase subunit